MLDSTRSFVDEHRDISKLVHQAERFSLQLPLVGRVAVPSPKQLAFYGALGALAVFEVIDWPVAVAVGVGNVPVNHSRVSRENRANGSGEPVIPGWLFLRRRLGRGLGGCFLGCRLLCRSLLGGRRRGGLGGRGLGLGGLHLLQQFLDLLLGVLGLGLGGLDPIGQGLLAGFV